jgi:coenzyme PQQ biosynthesis protein PqqD
MLAMPALLDATARPRLARRARLRFDRQSGRFLLLCPERGLILNESAAAILLACSGLRTVAQIARYLAAGADVVQVQNDTLELLSALRRRRLIVLMGEAS